MKTFEFNEIPKVLGLDMRETLEWYKATTLRLPKVLAALLHPIEDPHLIELSAQELGGLFSLFPENAQKRSILRKVIGKPATWFHKNSTSEQPIPTTEPAEALSSTAIIPSYVDYTPWKELRTPTADIWLYQIPQTIPEPVRKIILTEGFIHEVGHTIVNSALYVNDYTLKFPNEKLVNGLEAILHFAELAEKYPPISHYASTYRGPQNKFESVNPNYKVQTAVSEELCETIAAYFLEFAYCGDDARGKEPFKDRPEVKAFVKDFLNAELVKDST